MIDIRHTFVATSQPKGSQCPYDPKDVLRQDGGDLTRRRIRSIDAELRAGSRYNLLLFRASELAQYCLCD